LTSGTQAAECEAARPQSVASALEALKRPDSDKVGYVEEIRHPAIKTPLIAKGTFRRGEGGLLFREQSSPEPELVLFQGSHITIMRDQEAPEVVFLPSDLSPLVDAVRAFLDGDAARLAPQFDAEIEGSPDGWRLQLSRRSELEGVGVSMIVCGAQLTAIEIAGPEGQQRMIRFQEAE